MSHEPIRTRRIRLSTPLHGRVISDRIVVPLWLALIAALLPAGDSLAQAPAKPGANKKKVEAPQKKAAAASKKEASSPAATSEGSPFVEIDFDSGRDLETELTPILQDKDETAEGRQRLKEIEAKARKIYVDRKVVLEKRGPPAQQRDVLLGNFNQAEALIVEAKQNFAALANNEVELKRQLALSNGPAAQQLQSQIAASQAQRQNLTTGVNNQLAIQMNLKPKIDALNNTIRPYDAELMQLWNQLNEARKQWLEIRQPMEKYSRGEFESLRRVLDDWLLIDGLWHTAFAWAALCSHELQDSDKASEYLEKSQNIPPEFQSKSSMAQLAALTAVVVAKLPAQAPRAAKAAAAALRDADKKIDWATYFLVGRYYADRERELSRAKANFESALKIKPNCLSAKLWLARIQTTAADEKVLDPKAGLKTLEYLWTTTGKRSWRLAYFQFEALHRAGRAEDADLMWEQALRLAPAQRHEQMRADRKRLLTPS